MSRLTDLAIKKLAMRKEAGFDYNPLPRRNFAYLYSRAGWPSMSPDNEPAYDNAVIRANNLPWSEDLGRLLVDKVEGNPFNPYMPIAPSETGYPDIKDYKALLYNSMTSGFTPTEAATHQNKIFNPIASRLAYPGSAVERHDRRFQQGLDNVKKRDLMYDAGAGRIGAAAGSVLGRYYKKHKPKK